MEATVVTLATLTDQTYDLLVGAGPMERPQEDVGTLADASTESLTGIGRTALWKVGDYAEFIDNGEVVIFGSDASAGAATVRRAQRGTTADAHADVVMRKNPLYPRYLIERMVNETVRSMWPAVWTWHKDTLDWMESATTYVLDEYIEDVVEVYQYDVAGDERYHQVHPDSWRVVRQVDTGLASTGNLLRLHAPPNSDDPIYYTAKRRPHPDDLENLSAELADLVPWMAAAKCVYARGQAETYSASHNTGPRATEIARQRAQSWEGFYVRQLAARRDQLLLEVPKPRQWSPKRVRQSW
jgi:hypothetical protein